MLEKIIAFFMSIIAFFMNLFGLGGVANKGYTEFENLSYGTHERNVLDLYLPEDTAETGLVLFIHGGGWIGGDRDVYVSAAKDNCKNFSVAAATMNYRYLSEEVNMEDILDDIEAAVAKIKATAAENGIALNKMILAGQSAGGHLSMHYAYKRADTSAITPAAVINYCGPTDLNDPNFLIDNDLGTDMVLMLLSYATDCDITAQNITSYKDELAEISPITYVDENTVPTIINHGMKDTVVPFTNAQALDAKMTECGVTHIFNPYPNSGHELNNDADKADYAYEMSVEYIKTYLLGK